MLVRIRVQQLGLQDLAARVHVVAIGLDGLAGVGVVDHLALDVLVSLLVDDEIDGVAVLVHAGPGVSDLGLRAVDDGLRLAGGDDLVVQDDVVVALILRRGAHELDVDIAARNGCVNAQRMVGAVDEFIVEVAPVDRRVHAQLDIGDGEHVRGPLGDLEVGVEAGSVDGRGDLADAAALLGLALAAGLVDDGLLVALLGRALADDLVERKFVAGVQDGAIDGLAGELQVLGAAGLRGMRAVAGAEHVGEVFLLQIRQRDLRLHFLGLDGDGRAGVRHGDLLRVIRHVKAEADLLGHELLLFLVVICVLHLGGELIVVRLQIDRGAGLGVVVEFQVGEIAAFKPRDDLVIELIGVERDLRRAGHDRDGLRVGVDGDDRVDLLRGAGPGRLVDQVADIRRVQILAGLQRDILPVLFRLLVGDERLDGAAVAAVVYGGVGRLIRVQGNVRHLGGEFDRPVRQDDGQRIGGSLLLDRELHGVDGRVALEPADVDARDIHVREDRVASLQDKAIGTNAEHRQQCHAPGNDRDLLSGGGGRFLLGARSGLLRRSLVRGGAAGLKSAFLSDKDPSYSSATGRHNLFCVCIIHKTSVFCNGIPDRNGPRNSEFSINNFTLRPSAHAWRHRSPRAAWRASAHPRPF